MQNKVNETQKTYTQQLFHKGIFQTRPRSSSFSGHPSNYLQSDDATVCNQTVKVVNSENQSNSEWQRDIVPNKKRKRQDSPTESANKQDKRHVNYKVPVHNQFEILSDEEPVTVKENKEYLPRPEPIFITGVVSIIPLRELIVKFVDINKFTMTTLRSGHVIKLMPEDIETYKTIRENLIKNNINHYTYQLKSERAYRIVIKGLHASENIEEIKEELQAKGHAVRQIVNVLHRLTKEKLPIYFVDLEPQANNKDVFNLKFINHVKVKIEPPYKKKEVLQCKRCQRFGHCKNQCFRPFRCVKCGDDHPTSICTKTPETEAVCANCQGKHPASYKGCIKYKQYKEKFLNLKPAKQLKPTQDVPQTKTKHAQHNHNENDKPTLNKEISYANVLKNNRNNPTTQTREPTLEASQPYITNLLDTMFDRFQAIMKNMMDSMIDQMIKLITRVSEKQA